MPPASLPDHNFATPARYARPPRAGGVLAGVLAVAILLSAQIPNASAHASAPYLPGRVVVGYAPRDVQSLAVSATTHEMLAGDTRAAEAVEPRVLTLKRGVSVARALRRLDHRAGVRYAVPDYIAHATATPTSGPLPMSSGVPPTSGGFLPDDPGNTRNPGGWRALQWNLDGEFGVGAPEAWSNLIADGAPGGRGVVVAVLDTGVAYENRGRFLRSPDFEPWQFVKGYDFVADDPYPDDRNGHGTFVAGEIAEATNNGHGLTGLAYGVKIMPVRVLDASGEGDAATIARGVRYAVDHGAQVINLSLEFAGEVSAGDVPELVSALDYAHRHGVVIVAAAGNEASTEVPYPARDRFAISVGASTEHGCLANYSNYGHRIDLVAPGGGGDANIAGDPHCRPGGPPGRSIYQETFMGASPRVFGLPGGYEGTSMACPEVAAAAALVIASGVLGARPTPAQVRWRLEQTAHPLGTSMNAFDYGHGLLDAAAATATGGPGAIASHRAR